MADTCMPRPNSPFSAITIKAESFMRRVDLIIFLVVAFASLNPTSAQQAGHDHGQSHAMDQPQIVKPRVFLDKNPRIVAYQLKRLSNAQLLLVDRSDDDAKYVPVHQAIALRPKIPARQRREALRALAILKKSTLIQELLDGLAEAEEETASDLTSILASLPATSLNQESERLRSTLERDSVSCRVAAYAGLVVAGHAEEAWQQAESLGQVVDVLASLKFVSADDLRQKFFSHVMQALAATDSEVQIAALQAAPRIPERQDELFKAMTPLVKSPETRDVAIASLLKIPNPSRAKALAEPLVKQLLEYGQSIPVSERPEDPFINAIQLIDELLVHLPLDQSKRVRDVMREISVRVIRLSTVYEEMRYDKPYFAVEAGRAVQIILYNDDLMPHNLVITAPGRMREIGQTASKMPQDPAAGDKQYVPASPHVLASTPLIAPGQTVRLTFNAPQEPGEYPYVCTFPGHWLRMYGVMVVVEDLDAFLASPKRPADPLGLNRSFVQNWKPDDLQADLDRGPTSRMAEAGKQVFEEAGCVQCHKLGSGGGAVGPDLTEVFKRWKGNRLDVLTEILDPSRRVDEKYIVHLVQLGDGRIISGIVTQQNDETITIIANPENPKPQVIDQADIEEMVRTDKSMMPKGLLDRYTKQEILSLIGFLESGGKLP